jgi:replicative DNA helicase
MTEYKKFTKKVKNISASTTVGSASPEAEQAMLGAILIDNYLFCSCKEVITSKAIYDIKHKFIYSAMWELHSEGKEIDVITVSQKLKDKNQLDKCGGRSYLSALTDHAAFADHALSYAQTIREKASYRDLKAFASEVEEAIKDETIPIQEVISETFTKLLEIDTLTNNKSTAAQAGERFLTELKWRQGRDLIGVSTGFPEVDTITKGIPAHCFAVLAAGTGTGKTTGAINMVVNIALGGTGVLYLTLEVPDTDLMETVIPILSSPEDYFSYDDMFCGDLSEEKFATLEKLKVKAAALPLHFLWGVDKHTDILVQIEHYKRKHNIGLVVIDHLQLIEGSSEYKEFAAITKKIKNFCLLKKIPVLALSQLNNEHFKRADKEPMLSDLKGSGTISTDADMIFFLYKLNEESSETYFKLAKYRRGKNNIPHYWKTVFDEDTRRLSLGEKVSKPKSPSTGPGWKKKKKKEEVEDDEPDDEPIKEPECQQLNMDY